MISCLADNTEADRTQSSRGIQIWKEPRHYWTISVTLAERLNTKLSHSGYLSSKIIYRTFIWAMNAVTMVTFWELTAAIFVLVSSSNLCMSNTFCSICLKLSPGKEGNRLVHTCWHQPGFVSDKSSHKCQNITRCWGESQTMCCWSWSLLKKDLPVLFGANFLLQLSLFAFQFRKLLLLHQQHVVLVIQLTHCLLRGRQLFIKVS